MQTENLLTKNTTYRYPNHPSKMEEVVDRRDWSMVGFGHIPNMSGAF